GDVLMVGNVKVEVMHTPGHTPEHICFMITDTKATDRPMGVFSGDFIFVGDVGRPDLLERAAGHEGTMVAGAKQLYASIQPFHQPPSSWTRGRPLSSPRATALVRSTSRWDHRSRPTPAACCPTTNRWRSS